MIRSRTSLPFSTTTLLGLHQPNTEAVVLDDMVMQLENRCPRESETQMSVNRLPKAVTSCIMLKELFSQTLQGYRREIKDWVLRTHPNPNLIGRNLPVLSVTTTMAIDRFVRGTLIPRLRKEQDASALPASAPVARVPIEDPMEAAIKSFPSAQLWPRWFAIYRDTWYGLVPFSGQPLNGRFHLAWKGRAFIAMSRMKGRQVVSTYDRRLEELVRCSFQELPQQRLQSNIIYQGHPYDILRSQKQHYFACRQIPPYVIEGQSRALYLFPSVQIGIPICALEVDQAIGPLSAQVMHPYRHMFVCGTGGWMPICMPQPPEYYAKLYQLPLEEALLQHLEAARMTLCAGYHQGNKAAIFHDIGRLNMPRITLAEAQARGLPVYRYYRR